MFLAGGTCFLLLGKLNDTRPRLTPALRGLLGALVITAVELLTGLLANRNYQVWDYRQSPFNFHGQVCLPFSLLWIPVSLGAMALYRQLDKTLSFSAGLWYDKSHPTKRRQSHDNIPADPPRTERGQSGRSVRRYL